MVVISTSSVLSNMKTDRYIKFYHTKAWQSARHMALVRDHYLCQVCKRQGRLTPANTVHHIKHIRDDWSKRLDLSNLETICKECHNKEHPEKASKNKQKTLKLKQRKEDKSIFTFKANKDDEMLF